MGLIRIRGYLFLVNSIVYLNATEKLDHAFVFNWWYCNIVSDFPTVRRDVLSAKQHDGSEAAGSCSHRYTDHRAALCCCLDILKGPVTWICSVQIFWVGVGEGVQEAAKT